MSTKPYPDGEKRKNSPCPEIPPYICTSDYYKNQEHDDNYPEYRIIFLPFLFAHVVTSFLNGWHLDWFVNSTFPTAVMNPLLFEAVFRPHNRFMVISTKQILRRLFSNYQT
jgi:hypothetical protein